MKKRTKQVHTRRIKYPGIRPIARELGVTASHLWKCLEGHRKGRAGLVEEFWQMSEQHTKKQLRKEA